MMANLHIFWLLCGAGLFLTGGVTCYKCYSQFCSSKDCLKPDGSGKCDAKEFGCKVTLTLTSKSVRWDGECAASACTSSSTSTATHNIRTGCCKSELCNNRLPTISKGEDQCYSLTCTGKDCIKYGIGNNTISACPKTADGCFLTMAEGNGLVTYDVGCSSSTNKCSAFKVPTAETSCCTTDLCNTGEAPPNPPPNKTNSAHQTHGHVTLGIVAALLVLAAVYRNDA